MVDVEEAIKKTGLDLFKELYRVYPVAELEDYCKAGRWKDEQMVIDLQLIDMHRREAGADEPMDLEKVPDFKVPGGPLANVAATMAFRNPAALGAPGPLTLRALPGGAATPPGFAGATGPAPGAAAALPTADTAAAQLRLIAIFVAKYKLDPTKAKAALSRLSQHQRRYVIQNFKTTEQGPEATELLLAFITECQDTAAWGDAPPATAQTASPLRPAMLPKPFTGLKRPLAATFANAQQPAAKRPAMFPAAFASRPLMEPQAQGVGPPGLRPAQVPALRPAMRPAVRPATVHPNRPAGLGLRPMQPATRPPGFAGPVTPWPAAGPTTVRPAATGRPAARPAAPAVRPTGPKAAAPKAKAGSLIASLLSKF